MYFQVHQPYRLKQYSVFDIGQDRNYYLDQKNEEVMKKVGHKCYIPTNKQLLRMIRDNPEFKISYSVSGVALEQMEEYFPDVLTSFQELVDTGNVEMLDETYYHSLSFLYSKDEFRDQVGMHRKKIKNLFGVVPKVFRNTELIFSNRVAKEAEDLGYDAILAEGVDRILDWRSPNYVYNPKGCNKIKLLMKNYRLSDDIAFRFSNRGWSEYPLFVGKYSQWINSAGGEVVNLFMDYETFGEHQWEDTGIFSFLKALPDELLKNRYNRFLTPSEVIKEHNSVGEMDFPYETSWADVERDLSAWMGNAMQRSALHKIYEIGEQIKNSGDHKLMNDWRRLQTSDHFYYMCTKWFNDGDVHKYFNPYDSPYDCFIAFMNILNDMRQRIDENAISKTVSLK